MITIIWLYFKLRQIMINLIKMRHHFLHFNFLTLQLLLQLINTLINISIDHQITFISFPWTCRSFQLNKLLSNELLFHFLKVRMYFLERSNSFLNFLGSQSKLIFNIFKLNIRLAGRLLFRRGFFGRRSRLTSHSLSFLGRFEGNILFIILVQINRGCKYLTGWFG